MTAKPTCTYRTTVRSAGNGVVFQFQLWVKDRCVELDASVEAVADLIPVRRGFRHCCQRSGQQQRIVGKDWRCVGSGVVVARDRVEYCISLVIAPAGWKGYPIGLSPLDPDVAAHRGKSTGKEGDR